MNKWDCDDVVGPVGIEWGRGDELDKTKLSTALLNCLCHHLQLLGEAGEHVGHTLVDGSGLLQQQQAFRSGSKVQEAVEQRLLPDEPGAETEEEQLSAAALHIHRIASFK